MRGSIKKDSINGGKGKLPPISKRSLYFFYLTASLPYSLAQAKKQKEGIDDALHEMDKPLARYVDDVDRDALLKAQDRIGDPMLEYLSKKKSSSSSAAPG